MTKRLGRPPTANPRRNAIAIRLTDEELELLRAAAGAVGRPVARYIRERALASAARRAT